MMRRTLILLSAALVALTACAGPTPYQPAVNGYGYAEQQIESNRYRVSFAANSLTGRQTVENYLLYRAAELTIRLGGDYFVLVDRDIEPSTRYPSSYGGYGYPGAWGPPYRHSAFFSTGTERPITEYRAYADIVIYRGPKPSDDPNAYDAQEVGFRLAPIIVRPVPPA